jgi:hypothetical protein
MPYANGEDAKEQIYVLNIGKCQVFFFFFEGVDEWFDEGQIRPLVRSDAP